LDQDWEVFTEEEGRDVIVLVFYDVVDDCCHSCVLIVIKSLVDGVPVIKFLVLFSAFVKFVSIENRVLRREVSFKIV
jgi:hypothetical protein